jgi:pyridoxal phosphate enzyme (YggS family)
VRERIREACGQAGRQPQDIRLVAVSKTKPAEEIASFADLGVQDFGENYAQEALPKIAELRGRPIRWHFIGSLQTNKAKLIPGNFTLFHALDSDSLARKLDGTARKADLTQAVLVEVNIEREATKSGITAAELPRFLESLIGLPNLEVQGLMCIPKADADRDPRRPFAQLRELLLEVNRLGAYRAPLRELSMGMSADYPAAILEGATIVRVGTALFGERKRP